VYSLASSLQILHRHIVTLAQLGHVKWTAFMSGVIGLLQDVQRGNTMVFTAIIS